MRVFIIAGICVVLVALTSCKDDQPQPFVGTWQATELWESGKKIPTDSLMEKVVLQLNSDKTYTFLSTLNVKEAGRYKIRRQQVIIQSQADIAAKKERLMDIELLTTDSLHLRMTDNGRERILKFCKV